jgi:hypothetical protein
MEFSVAVSGEPLDGPEGSGASVGGIPDVLEWLVPQQIFRIPHPARWSERREPGDRLAAEVRSLVRMISGSVISSVDRPLRRGVHSRHSRTSIFTAIPSAFLPEFTVRRNFGQLDFRLP